MNDSQLIRRRLLLGAGAVGLFGVTGAAGFAAMPSANAEAAEPEIDSTEDWGARAPGGTNPVITGSPNKLIVHHTVSANTEDFSREQAHLHAQWVQDLHMDGNGWRDTGYNFIVSRGGFLTEGTTGSLEALRDGGHFIQGIHTSGQNSQALGISNEGSYHDGAEPTAEQWAALVSVCAFAADQYGIESEEIYGHVDFNSTLCPGIFHEMLPQLREEVEAARGE
ncbi:peptidoglycan recognition protein family protein [Glycomyces buryatensis]|uniref:N-acetylmuramoyl-L-alanine amidase n=1 Tax=Glycomyces buryatensis TaxID=2570927 RepID=A0A4V4HQY9_9ACTN|nr:peptidoglycan recognition family protein [Glycomyces buryatensis]THV35666.1 N-acetylmuramoyl-L-alanine amidase [Glycomyces buryatensis]